MPTYVISLEEGAWAALLVAITMVIHGIGMFAILRFTDTVKERFAPSSPSRAASLSWLSRA